MKQNQWRDYIDILARAGSLPELTWAPQDEQLRAEVHQQIALNLVQGYFYYFQQDPDYPDFAPFFNSVMKLQPNPDDTYYLARVNGQGCYRISGYRGTIRILNFTVAHDYIGTAEIPGKQDAECDVDDLDIAKDGSFELILSETKPAGYAGNWLAMSAQSNYVLVRMRSYIWGEELDPRLSIERLDTNAHRQSRASAESIDQRLRDLMQYAERTSRQWYQYQDKLRNRGFINQFELTRFEDLGGGNMQTYWQCVFELDEGEALLLETDIPVGIRYWNVQLNDELFNTLEYYYCQSSLNGYQARVDADGRFRAVVSTDDPGVPNWLDTVGRRQGTIIGRWLGGDSKPIPSLTRLPLAAVRAYLPEETPRLGRSARAECIRRRVRGGQMRRRW